MQGHELMLREADIYSSMTNDAWSSSGWDYFHSGLE